VNLTDGKTKCQLIECKHIDIILQFTRSITPLTVKIPVTLSELITHKSEIESFVKDFDNNKNISSGESKSRKSGGIYYTPVTIAEFLARIIIESYIVNTINSMSAKSFKDMNEILLSSSPDIIDKCESLLKEMRILDFSAGSGIFLASAARILLKIHLSIRNHRKNNDFFQLESMFHFLSRSLYGVDTDNAALKICKLRLLLTLVESHCNWCEDHEKLPNLDLNIHHGNSLAGFSYYRDISNFTGIKASKHGNTQDSTNENQETTYNRTKRTEELEQFLNAKYIEYLASKKRKIPDDIEKYRFFHWMIYFPEIMDEGGFDIIIGNPPYSARITTEERELIQSLPPRGTTQSANLFIYRMFDLLKDRGFFGLVLPKSLCHASNWEFTRKLLIPRLERVIDIQKAFKNVLLEQVLVTGSKKESLDLFIYTGFYNPRGKFHCNELVVRRSLLQEFNRIFLNLNSKELEIFEKVIRVRQFLGDICRIQRGFPWQRYLTPDGDQVILEGKNIQRYHLRHPYRKIPGSFVKRVKEENSSVREKLEKFTEPKVLLQNIVAHMTKPLHFIELYACVDEDALPCLDTAECLYLTREPDPVILHVIAAYLNSSFASWFAYRFIYTFAIRTMHFDNIQLSLLPFRFTAGPSVKARSTEELNLIDFDKDVTGDLSRELLTRILELDAADRINPLLSYIGFHGRELHEITKKLNGTWENMIQKLADKFNEDKINWIYRTKPYLTNHETLLGQLFHQKGIKDDSSEIERIVQKTFNQIASGRKKCIIIQKLIDRAVFGLFDLDQCEIDEINSNYHLRPVI